MALSVFEFDAGGFTASFPVDDLPDTAGSSSSMRLRLINNALSRQVANITVGTGSDFPTTGDVVFSSDADLTLADRYELRFQPRVGSSRGIVYWNPSQDLWQPGLVRNSIPEATDPPPSTPDNDQMAVSARRKDVMSLQSFQRDTLIVPNHDATLLTLTGDVADITDARWDSKSSGSVNPVFGTFGLRSNVTLAAGKIVGFGAFCALADDSKLNVYRLRLGGFALGGFLLVPYVGEPASAPAASTLVAARAFGSSVELLGFNEVVASNPSEGRSFFGGVAVMNPTGNSITAAVSIVGSFQACHVTAPRMALAVV